MKTKVIFREWPDKSIIALFPEINADSTFYNCLSYMRIGQHGAANCQGVIDTTCPAKDYTDLKNELGRLGYILDVRKNYTCKMRDNRLKNS